MMVSVRHLNTRESFHHGLILEFSQHQDQDRRREYRPVSRSDEVMDAGDNVEAGKDECECNGYEENTEAWRATDELEYPSSIAFLDDTEEGTASKDPPGISKRT
jgi:hypothetical protein